MTIDEMRGLARAMALLDEEIERADEKGKWRRMKVLLDVRHEIDRVYFPHALEEFAASAAKSLKVKG